MGEEIAQDFVRLPVLDLKIGNERRCRRREPIDNTEDSTPLTGIVFDALVVVADATVPVELECEPCEEPPMGDCPVRFAGVGVTHVVHLLGGDGLPMAWREFRRSCHPTPPCDQDEYSRLIKSLPEAWLATLRDAVLNRPRRNAYGQATCLGMHGHAFCESRSAGLL